MGNLSISLVNAAAAQRAFDRALQTIQNNVTNVYTPGWSRQRATIINNPFNVEAGLPGGIRPGSLQDSRSTYAETAVRDQQGTLNYASQLKTDLSRAERIFNLNSDYSIPSSLSKFFNSFSQLSVNPNNKLARQAVIDQAAATAQSFNQSATELAKVSAQADSQIRDSVDSINSRIERLQQINIQRRLNSTASHDAGLDAMVYSTLEELSQYASVQPIFQPDGTVNVYLSGRTPMLVGESQWKISADPSNASTAILDSDGRDITGQIVDGKLGALLNERNTLLPGYVTQLNTLAKGFADQVNQVQRSGLTPAGTPPTGDIFAYDSTKGEAVTLAVTNLTPDDLAAALTTAPGGNGNALNFAALSTAKTINGLSFSEYYGALGANFGRDLSSAKNNADTGESLLAQARSYRDELSGVDLNASAAELVQFQRAYQASAELFRVINELTQTALNMLH